MSDAEPKRKLLSERRLSNGGVFRRVEGLPTDSMFQRVHVAFLNEPAEGDETDADEERS
jgi:hypothetical protein